MIYQTSLTEVKKLVFRLRHPYYIMQLMKHELTLSMTAFLNYSI